MENKQRNLLGVCPIGKFVFSHEDALLQKRAIFAKLNELKIDYETIDGVLPDGMVRDQKHVEPVVGFFKEKKVSALFVPHCNFGTEGAAGMIAKRLDVPVLLWGPRDGAPLEDGSRLRDSLCGMFATGKVLHKLKVPFTYIENCGIDDKKFEKGLLTFLGASKVSKAMKNIRIGQLGVRIDFFWSTIDNESELLDKFGIQVFPIDIPEFLNGVKSRASKQIKRYTEELDDIKKWLDMERYINEEELVGGLAMRDELFRIADERELDVFSIQSFNSLCTMGVGQGLAQSLTAERIPIADESDIHGAVSSVLLNAAKRVQEPCFSPEYTIRHPENDNAVLLWHGSAPLSLRDPGYTKIKVLPPWILKGLPPTSLQFKLKDGDLTVCRFDGDHGEYMLGAGQGKTVNGPYTREFYTWMEVNNWPGWERMVMEGPYIHHCSCVYDNCADILEEACKYIPGLKAQRFDR